MDAQQKSAQGVLWNQTLFKKKRSNKLKLLKLLFDELFFESLNYYILSFWWLLHCTLINDFATILSLSCQEIISNLVSLNNNNLHQAAAKLIQPFEP